MVSEFDTLFDECATDELAEQFGVTISYARGATTLSIGARRRRPVFIADGTVVLLEHVDRDYLIRATDLGALTLPAKADRITDSSITYEVLAPPDGRVYEEADPSGVWLTVHAKRVSA